MTWSAFIYMNWSMNTKPPKSKISTQSTSNGQSWDLPAKKGVGFLMLFGCFFGGIPLLILTFTTFAFISGTSESEFNSIWGFLALFGFLSLFVMIGSLFFYSGFKMRYTSFQITAHGGAVEVIRRFLRKETREKIIKGQVHGVGLYSNSETNNKPDYGLLVKAREGEDIKLANGYQEEELRWLASEILADLSEQGGLPTEQELEETYFNSHSGDNSGDPVNQFVKEGVTVAMLENGGNDSEGDHFIIEKRGSTIAKSMLLGGLFGMIFSSVFIWIGFMGFGEQDGDLIFGIVGIVIATASLIAFITSFTKFGTSEKFTFKADTIIKEKLRGEISKSKTVFKKSSYKKLKVANSGNSNGNSRYSVKLKGIGGIKDLKLFSWVEQDISDVVKLKVNSWLKPSLESPTESASFSNGYGRAMATESSQKSIVADAPSPPRTSPSDIPIYSANMSLKDIKGGIWLTRIFLSIFLLVGLGLIIFGVSNFMTAKQSETWPKVQGVILKSKVTVNHGDDSTTYGADVTYRYKVEGKKYKGDKVTVSEISTGNQSRARKIIKRYPVRKKIPVYYNPSKPEESVLEQGITGGNWLLPGIGLLFFIVALVILIMSEISHRKTNKGAKPNKNSMKNIQNRYGKVG